MNEYRCVKCNALLFKGRLMVGEIAIMCRKCNYVNKIVKIGPFTFETSDKLQENELVLKPA